MWRPNHEIAPLGTKRALPNVINALTTQKHAYFRNDWNERHVMKNEHWARITNFLIAVVSNENNVSWKLQAHWTNRNGDITPSKLTKINENEQKPAFIFSPFSCDLVLRFTRHWARWKENFSPNKIAAVMKNQWLLFMKERSQHEWTKNEFSNFLGFLMSKVATEFSWHDPVLSFCQYITHFEQ